MQGEDSAGRAGGGAAVGVASPAGRAKRRCAAEPTSYAANGSGQKAKPPAGSSEGGGSASKKRKKSVIVTTTDDTLDIPDNNDWICGHCGQSDAFDGSDLVLCDGPCLRSFHIGCLDQRPDLVSGQW
jgi:hypothetical protein